MKINIKNKRTFAIVLLFSSLFFNGCEKEDLLLNNPVPHQAARIANPVNAEAVPVNNTQMFFLVTIEQQAARTSLPSYKVEVSSSGIVKFTGIRNTAVLGSKIFAVSQETLDQLSAVFVTGGFNTAKSYPFVPDVPLCITTFQSDKNNLPAIRIDYAGQQSPITAIRMKVIELLNLGQFINVDVEPVDPVHY